MTQRTKAPVARRLAMGLVVAGALLAAAEGVARLTTGPPRTRVVLKMPDGSPDTLFETDAQGRLSPARYEHREWWVHHAKRSGERRVVVLGGSSMAGPPTQQILSTRLRDTLGVTVVNMAIGGSDTGHLLAMLPGVAAVEPDVVVIYSGHNDLGNAVYGQLYADPTRVALARGRTVLGRLRLFGLLEDALTGREVVRIVNPPWFDAEVPLTAGQRAAALADFDRRLGELVEGAQATGATVVLSTVVSNAAWPPAGWTCPDRVRALGVPPSSLEIPSLDGVDGAALAAARAGEGCRDLDYLAGLSSLATDQPDAALLDGLRDSDPRPVRAPQETNRTIARVAARTGAVLVDSAAALRDCGGGIEPPWLFHDNVHLTEAGHGALTALVLPAVRQALGMPGSTAAPACPAPDGADVGPSPWSMDRPAQ